MMKWPQPGTRYWHFGACRYKGCRKVQDEAFGNSTSLFESAESRS